MYTRDCATLSYLLSTLASGVVPNRAVMKYKIVSSLPAPAIHSYKGDTAIC